MAFAPPSVDDIWETRLFSQANNQVAINTVHSRCTQVDNAASTLSEIASSFENFFFARYLGLLSVESTYLGSTTRRIDPLVDKTQAQAYTGADAGSSGTVDGDLIPGQVAGLISLRTERPGRGVNGRLFIPWMSEDSNNDSGVVDPLFVAALQSFGDSLTVIQALETRVGAKPTIHVEFGIWVKLPGLFYAFQAARARAFWATHRSRSFINRGDTLPL